MTNLTLHDPSLLETRGYVNGQWIEKDQTFAVMNPATGEAIANVADLSVADATSAIDAAYAVKPDWASWTGKERATVLRK